MQLFCDSTTVFVHTLVRYIDDLGVSMAGQAFAVLAERQANGSHSYL